MSDIQVTEEEYQNQKRALELLSEWTGSERSLFFQHNDLMFEYHGRLDKKQDGVWVLRAPGVSIQLVLIPPGAKTRFTTSASDESVGMSPVPGQDGPRWTLSRNPVL